MRILVTGGSGLIGQHCIEGLSKAGHTVTGTFSSGNGPSVEGKWVKVDLLNAEQRAKLIERSLFCCWVYDVSMLRRSNAPDVRRESLS